MEILCSHCKAQMSCNPDHGCWCADLPHVLPIPDEVAKGCLCPNCLAGKIELRVISATVSRVERYFPRRAGTPARVLLVNPAQNTSTPPLDLLKLSTFLRNRGYAPDLQPGVLKKTSLEPSAVVLTSVFSWEIPDLREALGEVHCRWPRAKTILLGVLPRKFGDKVQSEFDVSVLDEASEALLDEEIPDYALVPDWDASILITSKGVCPRECSHCETAAKGKGVTKLITKWRAQLSRELPRVEVWDNTLMLTPREHFVSVVQELAGSGKPVDLVCGLTPNGIEETELHWRISQLDRVQLMPARLECNAEDELPRFFRLLAQTRSVFGDRTEYRAFAIVNGTEPPVKARERIRRMRAKGVQVDVVRFTPHDWEDRQPYVNRETGWMAHDLSSI
jgi:hypothetical protein